MLLVKNAAPLPGAAFLFCWGTTLVTEGAVVSFFEIKVLPRKTLLLK